MKVQDVITRVRVLSGDTTSAQFTDAQLLEWINDGERECAVQNNLLQKRATGVTIAGTSDYTIPTDILKLHSVKYNNDKLRAITLDDFDKEYSGVGANTSAQTGTPSVCYIWADKLTLYPAPDSIKPLVIDYLYDPVPHLIANVATDVIALPVSYHPRIVDYAMAQVALQDDNDARYNLFYQQFVTGVQNLKDQAENTYDEYPMMSTSSRDMGSGWGSYGDWP